MPTELSDLDLDEVALVDAGANDKANIMLFKRGAFKTEYGRQFPMGDYAYVPDPKKPSTWKLRLTADPGAGVNARIVGAAVAAVGPTGFRGRKAQIPNKDLPKVKAKILAAWKKLHPDAKELPASLTKMKAAEEQAIFKLYILGEKGGTDMTPEELEKRFGELEGETKTLKADNETLTKRADAAEADLKKANDDATALKAKLVKGENPFAKPSEDDEDEEEEKKKKKEDMKKRNALPASVRKQLDDQDAELKKQADINKTQGEEIAKMVEANERSTFVSKAEATYGNLPVSPEEMGEALRGISKAAPGSLEVIEKALAAGDTAIKKAFNEVGGGSGEGGTAYEELVKVAGDIKKRDNVTKEQAFVKAKNENPELWAQHRKEKAQSAH